ncbi:hypothetical protein PTKU64_85190 [Paraburkholderia terrae]|uniref:Uncharacterized protein n=1 Tax=Paraburkholderia terrae TaxID=311230 RepID=A0ABM7U0Z0_9BURK|nr:hypothetical protein PTKU64_85190 [Paraburkholderia terrae]BDC44817.1 hypothetical protein PTKU15_81140 [Paraburkholderia terrae]
MQFRHPLAGSVSSEQATPVTAEAGGFPPAGVREACDVKDILTPLHATFFLIAASTHVVKLAL